VGVIVDDRHQLVDEKRSRRLCADRPNREARGARTHQDVRAVRGCDDCHADQFLDAVHFGEEAGENAFVCATLGGIAGGGEGIDFVLVRVSIGAGGEAETYKENNAGRCTSCFSEDLAYGTLGFPNVLVQKLLRS
jgi:hypothetical protein